MVYIPGVGISSAGRGCSLSALTGTFWKSAHSALAA
jgi:hypothetical protein